MAFGNNRWDDAMNASRGGVINNGLVGHTSGNYTPYGHQVPSGPLPGFGLAPRMVGGSKYEEIRDDRGIKMGDIITLPGGQRIEARDANGLLLGWYMPMYNLTYDARSNKSISQGNVLSGLLLNKGC